MKNIKSRLYKRLAICFATLLLISSGCSLNEPIYSTFTPDNFYKTDKEILSALSGIYRNMSNVPAFGNEYRALELSADQLAIHARSNGNWFDQNTQDLAHHTWTADNTLLLSIWNGFNIMIAEVNQAIPQVEKSTTSTIKAGVIAELRALRAYSYFYLLDMFGNVPIYTKPTTDPNDLPKQNTRQEVFDFVVTELTEAVKDLPTQAKATAYYGRITREAAHAMLATVYLNAKVYTGTDHYLDAISHSDSVILSNSFILLPNYSDNFRPDNENSKENIFSAVYNPTVTGGPGHAIVQKVMPQIDKLFGLPYAPQDGFGTRPAVIALYEDADVRKKMFMPVGDLKDPRTGQTVMVKSYVEGGSSILATSGGVPYQIIPATGTFNQPFNAGEKWIKWQLDLASTNGGLASNDISFFRYADILLIKAEAQFRSGTGNPLAIINQVRTRSSASALAALTLDDILNERGRELVFELTRRRDLIRFDKFTSAWLFKDASESFRTLFPIPNITLSLNPNLKQNPGYN